MTFLKDAQAAGRGGRRARRGQEQAPKFAGAMCTNTALTRHYLVSNFWYYCKFRQLPSLLVSTVLLYVPTSEILTLR